MNPLILLIISLKFRKILKDQLYFIAHIHLHFLVSQIFVLHFNIMPLNLFKFLLENIKRINKTLIRFNILNLNLHFIFKIL